MRYYFLFAALFIIVGLQAQEQFTLYFDFNEDNPNKVSTGALSEWLALNTNSKVIAIHGFADAADNNDYNYNLSMRRIEAVESLLKDGGIAFSEDLIMKPFGEDKASGNDEKDRKVVVYFIPGVMETKAAGPIVMPRKPLEASMFTRGNRIVLEGLLFFPDTPQIIPESAGALAELADIMINNPHIKIAIHGHMCCSAYDRTNLSGDRAKMIYKTLAAKGVKKSRMTHKGFGTTRPLHSIPEKNEAERLANRRVEIEVLED